MPMPEPAPKRLLIVDDEAEIRKLIREVAEPLGWTVSEAANGEELMNCINSVNPDLIFLDMVMPGVDGIESVQLLGDQKCTARIVCMTGYSPTYTDAAAQLGNVYGVNVIHTLNKPIPIAKLREVLAA